jgi:hypothetical protein
MKGLKDHFYEIIRQSNTKQLQLKRKKGNYFSQKPRNDSTLRTFKVP